MKQAEVKSYTVTTRRSTKLGNSSKQRNETYYEVVLVTKTGEKIVVPYGRSDDASRINSFLGNPNQKSLQETAVYDLNALIGNLIVGLIASLLFLFVGSFIFSSYFLSGSYKIVTWSFDKSLGCMVLKKRGLRSEEVKEDSIDNIFKVKVGESKSGIFQRKYRVIIVLKHGRVLPLTLYYTSGSEMPKLAERISEFLNLPQSSK